MKKWILFVALVGLLGGTLSASAQPPQVIGYGQTVSGQATPVVYSFQGSAGDVIHIETQSTIDTFIILANADGTQTLASHDDLVPNQNLNAAIDCTLPTTLLMTRIIMA